MRRTEEEDKISKNDMELKFKNIPAFWRVVGNNPNHHHSRPAEKRVEIIRLNILFSSTKILDDISTSTQGERSKYWR